jgi:hypothetical protein
MKVAIELANNNPIIINSNMEAGLQGGAEERAPLASRPLVFLAGAVTRQRTHFVTDFAPKV